MHLNLLKEVFQSCTVEVVLKDEIIQGTQFSWLENCANEAQTEYTGIRGDLSLLLDIRKQQEGIYSFAACLEGAKPFFCKALRFRLRYDDTDMYLPDCYVPNVGWECGINGFHRLSSCTKTPEDIRFCGLLGGSTRPCLLMGTKIPSNMMHMYAAEMVNEHTADFTVTTYFTGWQSEKTSVQGETTLVFHGFTPTKAFLAYGEQLPKLDNPAEPLIGWSTWDYYFSDVYAEDVEENMEQIRKDPVLSSRLKVIAVDDGWEYRVGEWYSNHHFPKGLEALAKSVRDKGFVPGIWTNGIQAEPEVHLALRHGHLMLKDEYDDAIVADGKYILDPTIPEAQEYIYNTYKQLYDAGFRVFKVDFVNMLMHAVKFHDPKVGPFEAMRILFRVIRRAVGPDSHIIGCSYEAEAGPGLVDSCRFGIDIHNHWSHVLWVLEYLQMGFWQNGRLYRVDPDFLVVRGTDTSLEEETNCFNPAPNAPIHAYAQSNRWRRGEVFNCYEAETWANIVVFSAGNVILSDRISMLNEAGKELICSHLMPNRQAAVPLDLSDHQVPSFWYSRDDRKLLVLNVEDYDAVLQVDFARYGVEESGEISCNKACKMENGVAFVSLRAHESAVLCW